MPTTTPTYILYDDDLYKCYSRSHIEVFYDNQQCTPEIITYNDAPRAVQSKLDDQPGFADESPERVSDD